MMAIGPSPALAIALRGSSRGTSRFLAVATALQGELPPTRPSPIHHPRARYSEGGAVSAQSHEGGAIAVRFSEGGAVSAQAN